MRSKTVIRLYQAGLVICWFVIAMLAWHAFWSENGYFSLEQHQLRIRDLEQANQTLSSENERLWEEVRHRRSGLFLEELARTELGYIKPGEKMVVWTQDAETPTPNGDKIKVEVGSTATEQPPAVSQ